MIYKRLLDYEKAEEELKLAIEENPKDNSIRKLYEDLMNSMGNKYVEKGLFEEELEYYQKAIDIMNNVEEKINDQSLEIGINNKEGLGEHNYEDVIFGDSYLPFRSRFQGEKYYR